MDYRCACAGPPSSAVYAIFPRDFQPKRPRLTLGVVSEAVIPYKVYRALAPDALNIGIRGGFLLRGAAAAFYGRNRTGSAR